MTTAVCPPTTTPATTAGLDELLGALDDAIDLIAQVDDLALHTGTAAGRALAQLAGLARAVAALLGQDVGRPLTHGPGVVVVRDLVAAARLLQRAVAASRDTAAVPAGVAATAEGLHAQLLEAMTTRR
jgi:hypothetical protein